MTSVERMLGMLTKVKGRNGSWTACCPAHNDKAPSLAIRETPDGRVLIHCFAGCETLTVVQALGMDMTDLFPPDDKRREYAVEGKKSLKPAFYASDLMRIISFEALVVSICAYDMSQGKKLSETDRERMKLSQQRIEEAMKYANV
jgi:hypothetical protein